MSAFKQISKRSRAIWSLVAAFILVSAAVPTANGLEFPTTSRLNFPASQSASLTIAHDVNLEEGAVAPVVISEMAQVALLSRQVEMARTASGAKVVARTIMADEYGWLDGQFTCLNRLWTKESHWNYQAHNYKSGAHGIAQALPATKMEVVSTDWRTNAVTQIRWGLRYIEDRYNNPCRAWAKYKRSRYY